MDAAREGNDAVFAILLEGGTRDSADASVSLSRFGSLYAAEAAELFVAFFLPLSNEHLVGVFLAEKPLIKFFRDGLALVIQVVDIASSLVG